MSGFSWLEECPGCVVCEFYGGPRAQFMGADLPRWFVDAHEELQQRRPSYQRWLASTSTKERRTVSD